MATISKESLETLRDKVDLVDLIGSYVELKKAGATYKALCPFHDEKTPSFTLQRGDKHYHCFGCGAHGDAIQFLTDHLKMNFADAVETLAEKYHVPLIKSEEDKEHGPSKKEIKRALELAHKFFQFNLFETEEGHEALVYLRSRGIDYNFCQAFQIGYALKETGLLKKWLNNNKISNEIAKEAGLLNSSQRDFFQERILFPIKDPGGSVIGFSGRKFREETFGGKYVNTPETPVFKKSKVLFGLDVSRKRIVKDRRAIIVEGQIDCLRLIYEGLNFTVAGQGTAFGEGHVREMVQLGVEEVHLALDSDAAGEEATKKVGNLFQKEGVGVKVISLPNGEDPDSFVRREGIEAFTKKLEEGIEYLEFLVKYEAKSLNVKTPSGKNEWVQRLTAIVKAWDSPLMVHESLKRLAELTEVPAEMVGVGIPDIPQTFVKRAMSINGFQVDPDRILESDLLRWLMLERNDEFNRLAFTHLEADDFKVRPCQAIFEALKVDPGKDLFSISSNLDDIEAKMILAELIQKKVNREKAKPLFLETLQKLLDRNWLRKREEIKIKIQSNQYSEEEVLSLIGQFDELKKSPPKVNEALGVL